MIYTAGVREFMISAGGTEDFQTTRSPLPRAEVGAKKLKNWENTLDTKGKQRQRERPKKFRTLVLEACKIHVPKDRNEIPTALTVKEKSKDRLRGLWKEGKTRGKGRKGTNY